MTTQMLITSLAILQQIGFTVAYLPQIKQIIVTESSKDISVGYYILRVFSLITLSIIFFLQKSTALYYTNALSIGMELYLIYLILKYRALNKEEVSQNEIRKGLEEYDI